MKKLQIDINATKFKLPITHSIAHIIQSIEGQNPVRAIDIFDTRALRPTNSSAEEQLQNRDDFRPLGSHWISKAGFVPLTLQYKLWQGGKPIRLNLSAQSDIKLKVKLNIKKSQLTVNVVSNIKVVMPDKFEIQGRIVSIKDVLFLKKINITDKSVTYTFNKEEEEFATINAIYNSEEKLKKLGDKALNIEVIPSSKITQRFIQTFSKSLEQGGCSTPQHEGEVTLFADYSQEGICYTEWGCKDISGRSPKDIKIGCYPNQEAADEVWRSHPMCNIGSNKDFNPFAIKGSKKQN